MGATNFHAFAHGKTAEEAFDPAVEEAVRNNADDDADDGCSGTIAEKYNFVMIPLPNGVKAMDHYPSRRKTPSFGPGISGATFLINSERI